MVSYRTNLQSRPLEEAFRFRGIPYRLIGAISFYERREVKDVLAYLRLIANPADDEAFLRVVNVPRRGIGDASLTALGKAAAGWQKPLLDAAKRAGSITELRPSVREALAGVASLLDRLRESVGQADPATALETILATTGYEQYLAEEGAEGLERMENVRELVAGAAAWAEVQDAEATEGTGGEGDGEHRRVVLTRRRSSRPRTRRRRGRCHADDRAHGEGLEADRHFRGSGGWTVPARSLFEQPGGVEEERRLCYRGLTRARERLYISWRARAAAAGRLGLRAVALFVRCHRRSSRSGPRRRVRSAAHRVRCHHGRHAPGARRRAGCCRSSDSRKRCRRTRRAT
jgi:superfamily I DNA/RNA helicase